MITYNEIYEASRKERYSEQLQKMSKNFVKDVAEYLREKRAQAVKDDDLFSDVFIKTKKQLENAITLFKELIVRRRKKILNLVLVAAETGISKQDFENMLDFERELFENIMKSVEVMDKNLNGLLNCIEEQKDVQNNLVVFLQGVEAFVGFEGVLMGPFEEGQMANLPKEIAKILIDDGKCEIIEK